MEPFLSTLTPWDLWVQEGAPVHQLVSRPCHVLRSFDSRHGQFQVLQAACPTSTFPVSPRYLGVPLTLHGGRITGETPLISMNFRVLSTFIFVKSTKTWRFDDSKAPGEQGRHQGWCESSSIYGIYSKTWPQWCHSSVDNHRKSTYISCPWAPGKS